MTTRLQFFSKSYDEDVSSVLQPIEFGYDGSKTVESFDPKDIPAYLKAMDCIFGPCIVVATTADHFAKGRDMVQSFTTYRVNDV